MMFLWVVVKEDSDMWWTGAGQRVYGSETKWGILFYFLHAVCLMLMHLRPQSEQSLAVTNREDGRTLELVNVYA